MCLCMCMCMFMCVCINAHVENKAQKWKSVKEGGSKYMSNTVDLNCRLCRAVQVVPVDQICIS